ncbi:MAG: AMP-binding protein, partial [Bacillota bacterium]
MPTSVGHLITFFALCFVGKTPAILNFSSGSSTVVDCARLAGVNCVITSRLFVEKAELHPLIEQLQNNCRLVYLEDVRQSVTFGDKIAGVLKYLWGVGTVSGGAARVILFTSGSENRPKGVVLKHANIIANVAQLSGGIDFSARDKMFNALPMFHSFGLTGGVVLPVLSGMETYLYPSPLHYKVIPEFINRTKATLLLGTPTFLMGYAKNAGPGDFATLRYVVAGGEKLKDEIRAYWRDNFAINIMEAYGTTEAAPGLCISSGQFYKPGSVGRFVPGLSWRIQEVPGIHDGGNLMIKGPNVMEGYLIHGRGFVPAEDWYDCGDVIRVDEEGYCTIIARLKRF